MVANRLRQPHREAIETGSSQYRQRQHRQDDETRRHADEVQARQPVDVSPQLNRPGDEHRARDDADAADRTRRGSRGAAVRAGQLTTAIAANSEHEDSRKQKRIGLALERPEEPRVQEHVKA